MCGIHAVISTFGNGALSALLERRLCNRGPDHQGSVTVPLDDSPDALQVTLTATVLSLRGDRLTQQPLVDEKLGSVLCWNGEAWKIRGRPVSGSDSDAVFSLLNDASASKGHQGILDAIRSIDGPFAFIYLDKTAKRMYYGRDRLGRRSLLTKTGNPFLLASIADSPTSGWTEVEADGFYVLQFGDCKHPSDLKPVRHDWVEDDTWVSVLADTAVSVLTCV